MPYTAPLTGSGSRGPGVYLTGTLDAAVWGADLAAGDGPGRICCGATDPYREREAEIFRALRAQTTPR